MAARPDDPTRLALLRAVADRWEDDTPRLVYADFLDENAEPDRAALIRFGVALANHKADRPDDTVERHDLRKKVAALARGCVPVELWSVTGVKHDEKSPCVSRGFLVGDFWYDARSPVWSLHGRGVEPHWALGAGVTVHMGSHGPSLADALRNLAGLPQYGALGGLAVRLVTHDYDARGNRFGHFQHKFEAHCAAVVEALATLPCVPGLRDVGLCGDGPVTADHDNRFCADALAAVLARGARPTCVRVGRWLAAGPDWPVWEMLASPQFAGLRAFVFAQDGIDHRLNPGKDGFHTICRRAHWAADARYRLIRQVRRGRYERSEAETQWRAFLRDDFRERGQVWRATVPGWSNRRQYVDDADLAAAADNARLFAKLFPPVTAGEPT